MSKSIDTQKQPTLRKRESKKYSKSEIENNAKLLEQYNDLKSIAENKEMPIK